MIEHVRAALKAAPKRWLVTGVAGFIGSNLLEELLMLGQAVIGLDNFSSGYKHNLDHVHVIVGEQAWQRFKFIEGDICDLDVCREAAFGVDYVLHHAALSNVPQSIDDPIGANRINIDGFLNILVASRDANVRRLVYAASSSTYGDNGDLPGRPNVEEKIGKPMSPYAVTKYVNELYADVFSRSYGLETIGLRYFNVFGPRQDPEGAYAAVIPKWIASMIKNEVVYINGTGETTRDFCYIDNVVQMNLLAATSSNPQASNQIYNAAVNASINLNELFELLRSKLEKEYDHLKGLKPKYRDFRPGDVKHSQADISKARQLLGYMPTHTIERGINELLVRHKRELS